MDFKKVECELGGLVNDNLRKLESIFPSVIKDGEVDFEELKELLGDFNEVGKEKYEMNLVCPCGCIHFHLKAIPINRDENGKALPNKPKPIDWMCLTFL